VLNLCIAAYGLLKTYMTNCQLWKLNDLGWIYS